MRLGEGGKLSPGSGKKQPGEGQSAPEFARGGMAIIDDVVALPGKPADLADPFKNSVLVALGAYLRELRSSGRDIEDSERAALRAMRDKLILLRRDCEKEGLTEKLEMLGRGIALMGEVLGESAVAETQGAARGWFARVFGKRGEK